MTAVRYKDEVVIIDVGIHPENYIKFTENEDDMALVNADTLVKAKAIPDVSPIEGWIDMVKAIVPGHAHLDHCGAIPYLGNLFRAPVLCTPFTAEVVRGMIKDRDVKFKNRISVVEPDGIKRISRNLSVEFIHTTHSTPQSSMIAVHTPEGIVLYASDFKFDMTPTLGKPPNIRRLKQLGKEKVLALIVESTYGNKPGRTPSEKAAKEMLTEAVQAADNGKNAIIVTTFSSHIARLRNILELGHRQRRKVVFLGRSIAKYISAAEKTGIINFSGKAEIVKFGSRVDNKLRQISKHGRQRYLLVCTGHQGEPKSVLSRIIAGSFLGPKDYVIFSCKTIPTPTNIANRERLETELKRLGIYVLVDVHQSGHGAQDELRELIEMVRPGHIIPSHGGEAAKKGLAELAIRIGFSEDRIHVAKDGDRIPV